MLQFKQNSQLLFFNSPLASFIFELINFFFRSSTLWKDSRLFLYTKEQSRLQMRNSASAAHAFPAGLRCRLGAASPWPWSVSTQRHVHVLQRLTSPQSWARGQSFSFKPFHCTTLPLALSCPSGTEAQLPGQGADFIALARRWSHNRRTTREIQEITLYIPI